ncbi:hypothetical protein SAMN05421831_10339 [Allopseudospirillum japonicum]|uniref:DUF1795 domain-containing protein n=1 Tax=Allopseudospirillum japonicum TaxID=64971 RepID=A0A1H6R2S5_9GAMM|nr:hypothetical protein [Allopseudospirillum japonicum]SEI50093.1 hypothetical protein SAMN05421831_10339 [Allopseudospirillum japonicum]
MRIWGMGVLGLSLLWSASVQAQTDLVEHQSQFGFRYQLPTYWKVLNAQELDAVLGRFDRDTLNQAQVDAEIVQSLERQVRQDSWEMIYNTQSVEGDFTDNININRVTSTELIPESQAQITSLCTDLQQILTQNLQHPIQLETCSYHQVDDRPGVRLAFELPNGNWQQQYMFQSDNMRSVVLVATYASRDSTESQKDVAAMIGSLKFTQ